MISKLYRFKITKSTNTSWLQSITAQDLQIRKSVFVSHNGVPKDNILLHVSHFQYVFLNDKLMNECIEPESIKTLNRQCNKGIIPSTT